MLRRWVLVMGLLAVGAGVFAANEVAVTREGPTTMTAAASGPATVAATQTNAAPAKRVVYIVDHSTALANSFEGIKKEIGRSVNNMVPAQAFDVVMMSENSEPIFESLQRATPTAKQELVMKLGRIQAEGAIDGKLEPFQEAFEKAFALKPELIYFLSGSTFDPALLDAVDAINKKHKAQIFTMDFARRDEKFEDSMKELAKRNDGHYKFVAAADVAATQGK